MDGRELLEASEEYRAATYEEHPWFWVSKQVKTFDEHDKRKDAKPFPAHKPYLAKSFSIWQAYPWLIEKKSRQLVKSWMYCAAHLHIAQFQPMSRVLLFSKDEDDTIKLLQRCWFIYENQDEWLKERFPARQVGNTIEFKHRIGGRLQKSAVVEAMPQGENEPRGQVATAVLFDEFSFNRFASKNLGNALPMAEGGGRITICFTAEVSFAEQKFDETCNAAAEKRVLFRGVDVHGDQVDAMELHVPRSKDEFAALWTGYAADPEIHEKICKVYAKYKSLGEEPYFRKEYDGDASALSGERVWPTLSKDRHGLAMDFQIPESWARYVSIDHGFQNWTAANWFAVSPPGWNGCVHPERKTPLPVLVCYREMHERGKDVDALYRELKTRSQGEHITAWIIDPSTDRHHGTERRGKSVFEQFREAGLSPLIKANNDVEGGLSEMRRRLALYGDSPAILFTLDLAHTWRECLHYRFKTLSAHWLSENDPNEEVRKKDDHHPDDVRYMAMFRPLPKVEVPPAVPRNSFAGVMREFERQKRRQPRAVTPSASFKQVMRRA